MSVCLLVLSISDILAVTQVCKNYAKTVLQETRLQFIEDLIHTEEHSPTYYVVGTYGSINTSVAATKWMEVFGEKLHITSL